MSEQKKFKYNKGDVVVASKNWGVPASPRRFHPLQDPAPEKEAHLKLVAPHQEELMKEVRGIKTKYREKPDRFEAREEALTKAQNVFSQATSHSFAGLVFAPWEMGYRFVKGQKYKILEPGDYPELFEDPVRPAAAPGSGS